MSGLFENSAAGPLAQNAIVECGVCWWTYDPANGAPEHDLLPHVGFSELPDHFRCPECDAPKDKFMLKPGSVANSTLAAPKAPIASMTERLAELKQAYLKAEDAMVGLPVHNRQLKVELVGFRELAEGYVGIVITPWSMNIALLPKDPNAVPTGSIGANRDIVFPSGAYGFLAARLDGFGALETCNLISPMDDFGDQDVARLTAEAALEGLFTAPEQAPEKPDQEKQNQEKQKLGGQEQTGVSDYAADKGSPPADMARRNFFRRRGGDTAPVDHGAPAE